MGILEGEEEERGVARVLKEIITEIFQYLVKKKKQKTIYKPTGLRIWGNPNSINPKKSTPRHTIIKHPKNEFQHIENSEREMTPQL